MAVSIEFVHLEPKVNVREFDSAVPCLGTLIAPENAWLEYYNILYISGAMLVSGRVSIFFET